MTTNIDARTRTTGITIGRSPALTLGYVYPRASDKAYLALLRPPITRGIVKCKETKTQWRKLKSARTRPAIAWRLTTASIAASIAMTLASQ